MKILVVGKGGREHALVWKLAQSKDVEKIYCAPGNAGIAGIAETIPIELTDLNRLADFAQEKKIDLTVVGPELPLTLGIVNIFEERELRIFGPDKEASEIEGSKAFAKEFMQRYHIPTASFRIFSDPAEAIDFISSASYPLAIKADGLAAGKGTVIVNEPFEAKITIENIMIRKIFGEAGERLVIEEFLRGEEVTVMALTDGERVIPMVSSQDHKRIFDGDKGPNTGGMGAYAPTNVIPEKMMKRIVDEILEPTVSGLAEMGRLYKGVLYTGIIVTDRGPKVLEYNCRFGDPETQAVLPLLDTDLVEIFLDIADGYLNIDEIKWKDKSCVCVVIASRGYPQSEEKDRIIEGLDKNNDENCMVFHAGTSLKNGQYVTNAGRILGVTAIDHSLRGAISKVYDRIQDINFDGMQYRKDVGMRAVKVDSSYF
jgi:phosphoribosylamine--glycine ligase